MYLMIDGSLISEDACKAPNIFARPATVHLSIFAKATAHQIKI
jgi:hypothetical protein